MMRRLTLKISGLPPEAQARPRFCGRPKPYSPKSNWYKAVAWKALTKAPRKPLDGPLAMSIEFIFPRPKSAHPEQFWKWTKPDLDNVEKGTKDALTAAGWWTDDGRVACVMKLKRLAGPKEPAGALIKVYELPDKAWRRG